MRIMLAGTVGMWLLASADMTSVDFWQDKEFRNWSGPQVEKMLTNSPWAKKVIIVTGRIREEALGGFEAGGAGLGGRDAGARSPDDAGFQGLRRVTVTVAWIGALPIRQAMLRRQIGLAAPIPAEQERRLMEDDPFYVLAVVGLPLRSARNFGTIDEARSRTTLKPNKKEPLAPADIRVFPDGGQALRIEFRFPRTAAIVPDDKEVVFTTKLGDVGITKKFRLADMIVRGELRL